MKTIFCDIDGTLLKHTGDISKQHKINGDVILLPGTLQKLKEWDKKGYRIILTTGRRESTRKRTEEQLLEAGIFYDLLIMGLSNGNRVLINDRKVDSVLDTAFGINIDRNVGIENVEI